MSYHEMKQVLIIAYYFPPMGLSGIQRTLKFVKYLPEYGWHPTVLTVSPHAYFAFDDSFLQELRGHPLDIWRTKPGGVFSVLRSRRTVSLKNEGARKFLNRLSQALFVPDNKIRWKKHALDFLSTKNLDAFDAVYATAPPFTDHLIGIEIKKRYGLPLVVDFRDAWLEYPYHIYPTPWHRARHQTLERRVVTGADAVVTTNDFMRGILVRRYASDDVERKCSVITQGYDPEDFERADPSQCAVDSDEVNFVYSGVFYEDRDPQMLYRALVELKETRPDVYGRLRFYMVGYVQEEYQAIARQMGVDERFVYCGYVEHGRAVEWLKAVDVAWFNIGARHKGFETVSPGKAFEYLGSGKPIMAILPQNEIRTILSRFDHTILIDPDDHDALVAALVRLVRMKLEGRMPTGDMEAIRQFDRRVLTGRLAAILEKISAARVRSRSTEKASGAH